MKRLLGVFAIALGIVSVASARAEAATFLSISVSGGSTVTCTSSGPCVDPVGGDFTVLNPNQVNFTGTVSGVSFTFVGVVGNSPGAASGSNLADSKFNVVNTTGGALTVTVAFAQNDFALPAGTPLTLDAGQGVDGVTVGTSLTQSFTGSADAANSLTPGAGVDLATPDCVVGGGTITCATNASPTSFARAGNFAVSGIQSFTLAAGQAMSGHASVAVTAIPEPASIFLLGSGLTAAAARLRRRKKNA